MTLPASFSLPDSTVPVWTSSQGLLNILLSHRFAACSGWNANASLEEVRTYVPGRMYHFRKHGECVLGFLKDGRLHVLNGPLSRWALLDGVDDETLGHLIAFCCLSSEQQEQFRNYMSPRCADYRHILHHLPHNEVSWRKAYLQALPGEFHSEDKNAVLYLKRPARRSTAAAWKNKH